MTALVARYVIPQALALLPPAMDTPGARAMLLAIGLQESRFLYRRQIGGPARGFWQFERGGGVRGVLTHPATAATAGGVLERLRYGRGASHTDVHAALEHNDVLACVFARLLLWATPGALPVADHADDGWALYLAGWRPGKPHPKAWPSLFREAWGHVGADTQVA